MDKAVGIQARNTCESLHNAVAHSGVKHMEVHWEEPDKIRLKGQGVGPRIWCGSRKTRQGSRSDQHVRARTAGERNADDQIET